MIHLLIILLLFVSLIAISTILERKQLNSVHTVFASIITCILAYLFYHFHFFQSSTVTLLNFSKNFSLSFFIDRLGLSFALLASLLWTLTLLYAKPYFKKYIDAPLKTFYICFALSLMSLFGMCFSKNLFSFFIFFELLSLVTYPLVIHKRSEDAFKAGRKYLTYTLMGGQAALLGMLLLSQYINLNFTQSPSIEASLIFNNVFIAGYLLLFLGFSVKTALMPFHGWLPSAMIAPTPVSALLHAVAVVKAGALGIFRLNINLLSPDLIAQLPYYYVLIGLAAVTIVFASLIAMTHQHIKKRLAYSTIGQISYITLGTLIGSPLAILGAFYHFFAHALQKITLFWVAGIFQSQEGKNYIDELKGYGYAYPVISVCFFICSLGLAGLPGMIGFISKENLLHGSIEAHKPYLLAIFLISGFLNLLYLIPITLKSFETSADQETPQKAKLALGMLIPPIVTTLIALVFGFHPELLEKVLIP